MPLTVPAGRLGADQAKIGFVDQCRGLERLARRLMGQPLRGELAQLVINQGEQSLRRLGISLLDRRENSGDVVHRHCLCQTPR